MNMIIGILHSFGKLPTEKLYMNMSPISFSSSHRYTVIDFIYFPFF